MYLNGRKFTINDMATITHALLLLCFPTSQKAQNEGSVWKRNETHLHQKQQWVESFWLAQLPWKPEAGYSMIYDLSLYGYCHQPLHGLVEALYKFASTYLSSPISDCVHKYTPERLGYFMFPSDLSQWLAILLSPQNFFPFSPQVLFIFFIKFYFLPDHNYHVLPLLQQDIIYSPSNFS